MRPRKARKQSTTKVAHRRMLKHRLVTKKGPMQRAMRQIAYLQQEQQGRVTGVAASVNYVAVLREAVEKYAHDLIQDAVKVAKVRKNTTSNFVSLHGADVETALNLHPHKFMPTSSIDGLAEINTASKAKKSKKHP